MNSRQQSIETLRDLKQMVDGALEFFESGGQMIDDPHALPSAYDMVIGRFGIIDIQERERLETEWQGKKTYPRFRGVKNLQRLFANSYE